MKKQEMFELARIGMRQRLKEIETDLQDKFGEFPDLFIGPPLLLRPELRNGYHSNGTGPVVTTMPSIHPGAKVAGLLPHLLKHGPSRAKDIAKALKLASSGSLSTTLYRHIRAGTIDRPSPGMFRITDAGKAALKGAAGSWGGTRVKGQKKTKKKTSHTTTHAPTSKAGQQRARTLAMLNAVAEAGTMSAATFGEQGYKKNALGPLIRRGYLARTSSGEYKRTAKVFQP
jgi:DNA-binding PadR family transcriptional regulator